MNIRVDASGMLMRIENAKRGLPGASALAVRSIASAACSRIVDITVQANKIDTSRYIRGWELANNTIVSDTPLPVHPLKQSRYHARALSEYKRRMPYYTAVLDRMEKKQVEMSTWSHLEKNQYYKDLLKKIKSVRRAIQRLEAYIAVLEGSEGGTAIVIGRRKGAKAFSLGSLGQVIGTIYGGSSVEYTIGRAVYVTVANHEPHARLVEWGFRKKAVTESGDSVEAKAERLLIMRRGINDTRQLVGRSHLSSRGPQSKIRKLLKGS